MLVQEPVQAAIWHCLNHYAYPDAIFLAERLRAEVDSDETLFLLATCYYRSGKPAQAYSILQNNGASSSQCRYLMAKCCIDLQKDAEAEAILTGGDPLRCRALDEIATEFGDSASFALALIAKVCCAGERNARGIDAYRRALKLNPFLWQAYEELCKRGEKPDPVKTFSLSSLDNLSSVIGTNPVLNYVNCHSDSIETNHNNNSTPVPVINILSSNSVSSGIKAFSPDDISNQFISRPSSKPFRYRIFTGTFSPLTLTPSFGVFPLDTISPSDIHLSPAATTHPMPTLTEVNDQKSLAKRVRSLCDHVGQLITRKDSPLQQTKPVFSQSCNTSHFTTPSVAPPAPAPLHAAQNVRRSSRLFSNSYSVKENNKSPNRNKFVTPKSPSRKTKSRLSKTNLNKTSFNDLNERNRAGSEKSETITVLGGEGNANGTILQQSLHSISQQALGMQKQSVEGLMSLLRDLGTAYLHLSQFNLKKAIEILSNVPSRHYNTGWVLCMIGKAYFELTDYQQAVRFFNCVREREPYRTQMMELYSTSLWHLQKEAALSALAQDLVALDRNCPAAWCAAGNCFSLQKEHDTAIKFLHRAVQVDPNFAYAYTILGHEYIATEELDKAMSCFRNAVRIDSRHYNAWYGIGAIYSKQERFQLAEIHFKRALSINQHSPVLMCHIGVVQNAQQKTDLALQTLNAAIAIDPKNPLCKFHRASIFFAAGRHAEALKELEELKEIVPKESLVYYLTGKVHKKLGHTHLALMHFSWATDLDPKGANSQIKEAIDPAISQSNNDGLGDDIQPVAPASADAAVQEQPMLQMQDSDDSLMD